MIGGGPRLFTLLTNALWSLFCYFTLFEKRPFLNYLTKGTMEFRLGNFRKSESGFQKREKEFFLKYRNHKFSWENGVRKNGSWIIFLRIALELKVKKNVSGQFFFSSRHFRNYFQLFRVYGLKWTILIFFRNNFHFYQNY